jgi:hypothetical protein
MTGRKVKYHPGVDFSKPSLIEQAFKEGKFTILDSGERKIFSSGMQRDSCDKIRYDLIYLPMLTRWAQHMTNGAKKYSSRNWEKAETVDELDRFLQSSFRHFIQWFTNVNDGEDHASACWFNICGAEMVKEKLGENWKQLLREYQLGKIEEEPIVGTVVKVSKDGKYGSVKIGKDYE